MARRCRIIPSGWKRSFRFHRCRSLGQVIGGFKITSSPRSILRRYGISNNLQNTGDSTKCSTSSRFAERRTMDIKLDNKPGKPPREGDNGLGIPQSRVEGARILTDTEGKDHPRQRARKLRYESEKKPKEDANSMIAAPDNGPGKSLREGDDGLGIPQSPVEGARTLTNDEIEKYEHQQDAERQREFEEKLEELRAAGTSFNIPTGVLRVVTWIGWGVASVLGLFLVAQGAALVDDIQVLPTPFNWIAGVSASAFATILVVLILKLGIMLARLHRSPTVPLRSLAALQQRERWRHLAKQHTERAKGELQDYLKGYELGGGCEKTTASLRSQRGPIR